MKILQVLSRLYLSPEELEPAVGFYEALFGEACRLRFTYPEAGLELAQVGSFLMIAGKDEALERFRATQVTLVVDSLDEFRASLLNLGAIVLEQPKTVPTGRNMRVRHPDGSILEYVELLSI